jgi:hypothetical protein
MSLNSDRRMQPRKELCFLVGAPRSGTTWLQRLLQTHPKICGDEESAFFAIFGRPLRAATDIFEESRAGGGRGPLTYMDIGAYEDLFRMIWNEVFANLYRANPDCKIHLEKTPEHIMALNEIVRLFPNSRIIALLRDSRAVASSLVHAGHSWGEYWAPKSYREAATLWYVYMKVFQKWRLAHPEKPCLVLRYEDLTRDPKKELCRALQFLKLEHDNSVIEYMLERHEHDASKRNDLPGFARKRGADGWRKDMSLYAKIVTWRYTRKMMRELGYECRPFA